MPGKPALTTLLLITILSATAAFAQAQSPLDGLTQLRDFRAMRASSTDANLEGNGDCRGIARGQTLTIAELEGPGKIAHIWFTITPGEKFYGKLLVLRMYWDGEQTPSVECPVNDFFCQGHGLDVQVNSFPVRVTSDGRGRNCYWSMPFAKSARITVTNEAKQGIGCLYYYVDWQKMDRLPANSAYFHAQYRQEYPCIQGRDYLILDAQGKGQFVGCNLSVRNREDGWWGEGDDRFYIDGEKEPSIRGTGSEDYFCDGWGIHAVDGLYYGFPVTEGYETLQRSTSYRFHIQDPVPFAKSLRFTMEHKGARLMPDGKWNGYVERADDFSSVAYWYQAEPHKAFPPLPAAYDRLYKDNSVSFEGESLLEQAEGSAGKPIRQDLGGWSGGAQLFYMPKEAPASLTLKVTLPSAGRYRMLLHGTTSWDYGKYQAFLDGRKAGGMIDYYSEAVSQTKPINLGTYELSAGEHTLRLDTTAKNVQSQGYYIGLDFVEFIPLTK